MPYWPGMSVRSLAAGETARGMQIVETYACHVNGRRIECMCPAQYGLLRIGSLRTLLETTAIRNAAKDARDELRVIHIAEAEEELIVLAEIGIHASVKGVSDAHRASANWRNC